VTNTLTEKAMCLFYDMVHGVKYFIYNNYWLLQLLSLDSVTRLFLRFSPVIFS